MIAQHKAKQLYNEGLVIAKHYTFPHAEHGLAKEIALHSIKVAKEHADSNLKGWLDADVLAFLESVEQEIKNM